jgi:hypothetical protein
MVDFIVAPFGIIVAHFMQQRSRDSVGAIKLHAKPIWYN